MRFMHLYYPESKFGGFTDVDGTVAFYFRVNSLIQPSFVILDFGCGRGARAEDPVHLRRELQVLRGKVSKVIGLDIDEKAADNAFIDEFHLLTATHTRWPLDDDSIDLCLSDAILEHLNNPEAFFSEARRVIRNGGYLCIRTVNVCSYIGLFSKFIPNRYHPKVTSIVQEGRKEEDVFPTVYKCNTVAKIRALLSKLDFEHVVYGYESEPRYLSFSKFAYRLGVLHQRFAPKFVRPAIFAFAQARKSAS